jgi:hypothetical protein
MGAGSFTSNDWDNFKKDYAIDTKSRAETFSSTAKEKFNPKKVKYRESCETKDKSVVTPIIIALDVTGSMGKIPELLIKGGLGSLMKNILSCSSIPNPHVMFMAIGDVNYDKSPLQVTEFEADIRIATQLKDLFLEGGGGPNKSESYPLAWHFAATRTKLDSFIKRQEKGILFTIGDEYAPEEIKSVHLEYFLGEEKAQDLKTGDILAEVKRSYDVFHLGIKQSSAYTDDVQKSWQNLLGQRLIPVNDYTQVDSVIVNTIEMVLEERKIFKESIRQHLASRSTILASMSAPGGPSISSAAAAANNDELPTYEQATNTSSFRINNG